LFSLDPRPHIISLSRRLQGFCISILCLRALKTVHAAVEPTTLFGLTFRSNWLAAGLDKKASPFRMGGAWVGFIEIGL